LTEEKIADKAALNGLFLTASNSNILCVLGQNGAGKTTTMNILTGSLSPCEGDAIFDGVSVVYQPDRIRAMLGVCPQFDILWPHLSAAQHIAIMGAIKTGWILPRATIDKLLADVRLTHVC